MAQLQKYTIYKGDSTATPSRAGKPMQSESFKVTLKLEESFFYSWKGWKFDIDWWSFNPIVKLAWHFSSNADANIVGIAARPGNIKGHFELSPFTVDKEGLITYEPVGRGFTVVADKEITVSIYMHRDNVTFNFEDGSGNVALYTHKYDHIYYPVYQQIPGGMARAKDEKGFGGVATQDMVYHLRIDKI